MHFCCLLLILIWGKAFSGEQNYIHTNFRVIRRLLHIGLDKDNAAIVGFNLGKKEIDILYILYIYDDAV